MFRSLAAVAAAGALLVGAALPASAAVTQNTVIDGFAVSSATVAYQQSVTFTGKLLTAVAATPVAGEPVDIVLQAPPPVRTVTLATVTTGSDGGFSLTTTLPSGGFVRAWFHGDTGLGASSTPYPGKHLAPVNLPSRILLDRVPGSVPAGTAVTFSGTVQVQVNGVWQPFPDAPVELSSSPSTRAYSTAGPDGRFALTIALTETAQWYASLATGSGYWGDWYPDWTQAGYPITVVVSRTRITTFRMPASDEVHHANLQGLYASGTVQRWDGSAWIPLVYGSVSFSYRPKGSTVWRKEAGVTQTDRNGAFRARVGLHLGSSDWRASVVPDTFSLTSTGPVVANTLLDRTHVVNVAADRRSTWTGVFGQISDQEGNVSGFASLRGLQVRLYYRAKNSSVWHYVKTSTLDTYGFFSFGVNKNRGYLFRVVLPAQGPFLGCTSRAV